MKYLVALHHSDEGYAVFVPSMPGCNSQGVTREEALANIADAIRECMEIAFEQIDEPVEFTEVEVATAPCPK